MQKLVWQNANGVELDLTSGNYGITEWEGFSNASLNIQSQQVPFQDGGVFLDALIEQRELTITLAIQDNNNLELRYQQRRELISALNPKLGEGYLIYTNDFISKRIKCVPQIPLFETHNSDTVGTPKASLSWTACEPYWEDLEETVVEVGATPVTIENNGDIPCQIKAVFKTGAKNPVLINNTTDKEIALDGTYTDPVIVNTNNGEKQILKSSLGFNLIAGGSYNTSCYGDGKLIIGGTYTIIKDIIRNKTQTIDLGFKDIIYVQRLRKFWGCTDTSIYYSENGIDWTKVYTASSSLEKIAYSSWNKSFVALGTRSGDGDLLCSTNGVDWEVGYTQSASLYSLAYSESKHKFILTGTGGGMIGLAWTSTDGKSWDLAISTQAVTHIDDIVSADRQGKVFVYTGNKCFVTTEVEGEWSAWQQQQANISVIAPYYSNELDLYIGVSGNQFCTSTDGLTWVQGQNKVGVINKINYISEMSMFFATGSDTVYTSTDGNTWENYLPIITGNINAIAEAEPLRKMCAVGVSGSVYTSEDGENWEQQNSGVETNLNDINYINELNIFIAVGNNGTILTSLDGISWTQQTSGTQQLLSCVTYSQTLSLIIIGGNNGTILTSLDGISWTQQTSGTSRYINGIACSEEKIIAVVYATGYILTSEDGENWEIKNIANTGLKSITYSEELNCFVVISNNQIFKSTDGLIWKLEPYTKNTEEVAFIKVIYSVERKEFLILAYSGIYSDNSYNQILSIFVSGDGEFWDNTFVTNLIQLNSGGVAYINRLDCYIGVTGNPSGIIKSYETGIQNIIQDLTGQSDMTFNLKQGNNEVVYISGSGTEATITYRKKYIGV